MTKKSRTLLFLVLAFIFLTAAPSVIFFSQGYRVDFQAKRFAQIGAFYFDAHPTKAQIFIDGKKVAETARFTGDSLSKNLLPKTYHVELQKEGYVSWNKNLEIIPKQVTEARSITLFPENPEFSISKQHVQKMWVAPNGQDILTLQNLENELWALTLWNTRTDQEHYLLKPEFPDDEILNIQWAPNSNSFFVRLISQKTVQAFIIPINQDTLLEDLSNTTTIEIARQHAIPLPFLAGDTEHVEFLPSDTNYLMFLSPANDAFALSQFNLRTAQLENTITKDALAFELTDKEVFWIDTKGIVWKKQFGSTETTKISQEPAELISKEHIRLHILAGNIFLTHDNTLHLFNAERQSFEKFLSNPEKEVLSPSGKKIAFSNGNEISILFLDQDTQQPAREKGEKILLTRISQKISDIHWINDYYIMINVADTIQILEIDTRDRINVAEIATFPDAEIFWQPAQSLVYVHSQNQIYTSQKFWP